MTTTVAIALPWGRLHATPWGRSTTEGVVEWPPSPWRLLRAFFATWKWHCGDLTEQQVEGLLARLGVPPRFFLPPHTVAHTRHYLPDSDHRKGVKISVDKTLDTFVVTEPGAEILVEFSVDLTKEERRTLSRLCDSLAYLGRAESIVEVRLLDDDAAVPVDGEWIETVGEGECGVATLAVDAPLDLTGLTGSPQLMLKQRRPIPRGATRVRYRVPEPWAKLETPAPPVERARVTAIRFAITGRPLPPLQISLAAGDLLHKAAIAELGKRGALASPTLRGKIDAEGDPLGGPHGHAHFLPIASDDGQRIAAFIMWAPDGFDATEVDLLSQRPIRLWAHKQAAVHGINGQWAAIEATGNATAVAPELTGPSRVWESVTPFSPTRHNRRQATDPDVFNRALVQRELGYRGCDVDVVSATLIGDAGEWNRFRRHRPNESMARRVPAYGLRVELAEAIDGPLAIGRFSHFGLGLFRPVM
jgi:CRISPR-associated protein Csb2